MPPGGMPRFMTDMACSTRQRHACPLGCVSVEQPCQKHHWLAGVAHCCVSVEQPFEDNHWLAGVELWLCAIELMVGVM